jgi:hypothetical protein
MLLVGLLGDATRQYHVESLDKLRSVYVEQKLSKTLCVVYFDQA